MNNGIPNPRIPVASGDGYIAPEWYRYLARTTVPVSSFNGRDGNVTLTFGDITTALGYTPASTGGTTPGVLTKTGAYTETASTGIQVRLCSGTFAIALPTAVGNTSLLTFKNINTGTITLNPSGGQTIDGGSSAVISMQYASITLVSDNANWWII